MTQWVETPAGGRARGPAGLARAWVEVLVRPRRFFRVGIGPGDQAAGLTFAIAVTVAYLGTRLAFDPDGPSVVEGHPVLSGAVVLAAAGLVVAPVVLHLVAALQTLALVPTVPNRAGVSETVQVLAYATAPCALAGLPVQSLRLACGLYGAALLVVGISVVHRTSIRRAAVASALPAVLVFGYAFGAMAAGKTLMRTWA